MKIENPTSFSFAMLRCKLFGHYFKVSKDVTDHLHEYKCEHCGLEMTDTANGFWARLTPKFKETNEFIAKIHQRRKRRLLNKVS
ncbi:hypothetical protein [Christiangramia salexigens]|uniref:Prophage protein n=1 Tax=Christiangramia salexigens TaxID=1913577 RepID=A0A1L3J710_9FLAO|nr:hypothetical protein [Christiangramia salexigens]APG60932.1 hypothetical protein LPB144_11160 [Christiangramia salexigens]